MSVDMNKGATVELVKTLSDDIRTNSAGTKAESAGEAVRIVETKSADLVDKHNGLTGGELEYIANLEDGLLNTSGQEEASTAYVRTDFIEASKANLIAFYATTSPYFAMMEYDTSKTFLKRNYYNLTGVVSLPSLQSSTVYVRFTYVKSSVVKLYQYVPFADKTVFNSVAGSIRNIITSMSEECVHHDNFSRTMTGYEIGKNSESTLTDNSYDGITGVSSDDGVRVDDGLTIASGTRTDPFTVRRIKAQHASNFMIEFNAPLSSQEQYIYYHVKDAKNFDAITVSYNGTYYNFLNRTIVNGSFSKAISVKAYASLGNVVRLYFIGNVISCFVDDKYVGEHYADSVVDSYIGIGAYKGNTAKFDFVNVFNLITPPVYNTEYLTDNNVSTLPNSTLSANNNRYALDGTVTRFSNKSEHFMLYSTDTEINNGKRTERSLTALIQSNLRTMKYEFDVYFPSDIQPDTETASYNDIFFQLHDRQTGVSRGHVPFFLALVGDEIWLSQYASSAQASGSLTEITANLKVADVVYDKWMHFDLYIKERYAEVQQPFMELKIDGAVVYQSRKPNCANDVNGSSAQYGVYKNNFGVIEFAERYIDNFKVRY